MDAAECLAGESARFDAAQNLAGSPARICAALVLQKLTVTVTSLFPVITLTTFPLKTGTQ